MTKNLSPTLHSYLHTLLPKSFLVTNFPRVWSKNSSKECFKNVTNKLGNRILAEFKPGKRVRVQIIFYQETFKKYSDGGYRNCFQGGFFHIRHQKRHLVVIKDELVVLVLYYAAFLVNFGVAACLLKRLSIYYCLGLKTKAGDSI